MGPIGCPETPVTNYQSTLRNNPEELKFHLYAAEAWKHTKTNLLQKFFSQSCSILHLIIPRTQI
jgi:hypothetical protein